MLVTRFWRDNISESGNLERFTNSVGSGAVGFLTFRGHAERGRFSGETKTLLGIGAGLRGVEKLDLQNVAVFVYGVSVFIRVAGF